MPDCDNTSDNDKLLPGYVTPRELLFPGSEDDAVGKPTLDLRESSMGQLTKVPAKQLLRPSGRTCQTPLSLLVLCWLTWQILNFILIPLHPVSYECSVSKSLKKHNHIHFGFMSFFPSVKFRQITGGKNKPIQQISGVRSLAQDYLQLTCLLGRGSHSLAVIFYLSPQDVLLHSLFQGPLLPVCIPTAAEGDSFSLHLEACEFRVLAVSLSWCLCIKV